MDGFNGRNLDRYGTLSSEPSSLFVQLQGMLRRLSLKHEESRTLNGTYLMGLLHLHTSIMKSSATTHQANRYA
jgi:hypothetical protein